MTRMIVFLVLFAIGTLGAGCTVSRGEDSTPAPPAPQQSERVLTRVEFVAAADATVLARGTLSVTQENGETQPIPVVLEQAPYRCTAEVTQDGKTEQRQWELWLSKLTAADAAVEYSWALWSDTPPLEIKLFTPERGSNFLARVYGADVDIDDVSRPRDPEAAFRQRFSGKPDPQRTHVPVRDLLPEVDKWGVDAFNSDIRIVSVSKPKAGDWTVVIESPEGKEFTIVGDGEMWRLAQEP